MADVGVGKTDLGDLTEMTRQRLIAGVEHSMNRQLTLSTGIDVICKSGIAASRPGRGEKANHSSLG
jgi:hypothetical protein